MSAITIEQGLREIVADHDLLRFDIGFAVYDGSMKFGATAWWGTTDDMSCSFGSGATVDDAVNDALANADARRSVQALAA